MPQFAPYLIEVAYVRWYGHVYGTSDLVPNHLAPTTNETIPPDSCQTLPWRKQPLLFDTLVFGDLNGSIPVGTTQNLGPGQNRR